ncbi:MAG: alpha-L-fucosidase [Bacteroidetes bacterium]|nr:alpha-L-fucosidase [Bacteroidota bacterium]
MKSLLLPFLFLCFSVQLVFSQEKKIFNETSQQKSARLKWWTDARFGMFIHWGLYSLPARHEWVKNHERITNEQYQKYFDQFNPDEFDPKKWAKAAKAAGMKYAVLTSKHHEGFCLFDSKYTDYKATKTKAHRDLVKEFVEAFRAEGIHVGFYYSLLDWHHPDYTVDDAHPQRAAENLNEAEKEAYYSRINKGRDMAKYRQYMKNQVTELLTNYGKIDILWLDWTWDKGSKYGKHPQDWGAVDLIKLVRKLQPGIIVNNRLGLDQDGYSDGGDFVTPEQVKPAELIPFKGKYWETCQTFSGSWGYYRDENSWKNQHELLDLLVTSTANGGNLILNVGPTARGEFDYRATRALDSLGLWMHENNISIYHATYPPDIYNLPESMNERVTYNAQTKKLYIHLFNYPEDGQLILPNYQGKISYAQFLHDDSEIPFKVADNGKDLILTLPKTQPPYVVPVIELNTVNQ